MFKQYGPLTKCRIAYDNLGRSLGTATVEYEKSESAKKAITDLNGLESVMKEPKSMAIRYQ